MKAADVIRNGYTENLNTDWVAVDAQGNVVGRTADEHTARVFYPEAAGFFTGEDFEEAQASAETKGGGAFDLDNSGAAGGSPKGEQSSAAIGAQRKREKAETAKEKAVEESAQKKAPEHPKKKT